MSQGNDFANYSAAASNATTGGSEEVWFVAVASDDIKQMTIDQLDEAFRLGVITGETPVWTEGMEAWSPLAQVADLDNQSSSDDSSYEASGSHPKVEKEELLASRQPATSHSGGTGSFGVASSVGAGFGAVTLQSVQHSFAPGPSSVAPVTASYAPSAQIGQSSVPVAIGDDDELPQAKRGGGFRPARWVLAGAAAVIAVGVIAYNNLSSSVASAGTEAAAAAPALAARPYDGADGADRGAAPAGAASRPAVPSRAADDAADEPAAPSSGAAAVAGAAAAASTTAKAALVASPSSDSRSDSRSDSSSDEDEPASSKKGADKESLKNTFSKSLTKKSSAKAAKVKPRKAASRATKSRATKAAKKSTVVRSQSAFDPLNDSLP